MLRGSSVRRRNVCRRKNIDESRVGGTWRAKTSRGRRRDRVGESLTHCHHIIKGRRGLNLRSANNCTITLDLIASRTGHSVP